MPDMQPRVYVQPGDQPGTDHYFRVSSGGVYARWDALSRQWIHVTDPALRDAYSRAIESGDGAVPATSADLARLAQSANKYVSSGVGVKAAPLP